LASRNQLRYSDGMTIRAALRCNWPDVAIIGLLAALPLLFFWRLVTPNPADVMNVASGDFAEQYYPLRAYAAHELSAGRLPLWNPFVNAGQPALADIQSGVLYPPQLLQVAILSGLGKGFPLGALEWQVILHFSWAAVGAYLLGRRLVAQDQHLSQRNARFAGAVTAVVFTYSGYLTGFPVQQMTILEVSAWLPWVLVALDSLAVRQAQGWDAALPAVAWTALAVGLAWLPGHPQTWLYVVYTGLAFYAWRVVRHRATTVDVPGWRYFLRAGGALALASVLAGALTAAQWLPTAEFITHSSRADMHYEALSFGLPLAELVTLIYPGYLGGSPAYLGIVPLVLIALAWGLGRPRREVIFWTAIAAVALLLSLGGGSFIYSVFYLLVPGFDAVRHQERAFLVYALAAALLSGYGALVLTRPLSRQRRLTWNCVEQGARRIFTVGLGVTFVFVYGSLATEQRDLFAGVLRHHTFALLLLAVTVVLLALRSRRWLRRPWGMALVVAWIAFNLFSVNWRFNLQPPTAWFAPTPLTDAVAGHLAAESEPVRIASGGQLPHGPGAAAIYRFQDIVGNTPLQLADYVEFEARVPEWRRWQLLNVHYVLSDRDLTGPGLRLVFPSEAISQDASVTRLYAVTDPFPRAWVVYRVEVIVDRDAALRRIAGDDFELRAAAVVDRAIDMQLPASVTAGSSTARVTHFAAGEMIIEVDAGLPGLLVISEIAYPGWQAQVDDAVTPIVTANGVLRGVPVPAGRHQVRLWYDPPTVRLGTLVSGLTVGGGVLAWVIATVRAWRSKPRRAPAHLTEPFDDL